MRRDLIPDDVQAKMDLVSDTEVIVRLPVAFSEGVAKTVLQRLCARGPLDIYQQRPARPYLNHPRIIDFIQRLPPVRIGWLEQLVPVKVEGRWILHAAMRLDDIDTVLPTIASVRLVVRSRDRDPSDRTRGRELMQFVKVVAESHPVTG